MNSQANTTETAANASAAASLTLDKSSAATVPAEDGYGDVGIGACIDSEHEPQLMHCGMQEPRTHVAPLAMVLKYVAERALTDTSYDRDIAYLLAYFKRTPPPSALTDVGAEAPGQ